MRKVHLQAALSDQGHQAHNRGHVRSTVRRDIQRSSALAQGILKAAFCMDQKLYRPPQVSENAARNPEPNTPLALSHLWVLPSVGFMLKVLRVLTVERRAKAANGPSKNLIDLAKSVETTYLFEEKNGKETEFVCPTISLTFLKTQRVFFGGPS